MASGKNATPIPNPFAIDYAPTDRATCKKVGDSHRTKSPRAGVLGVSSIPLIASLPIYDLTTKTAVNECARPPTATLFHQACDGRIGLDSLRFVRKALKRRSDALWSLKELLMEVPKKQLLPILDANNIPYNDKKISVGEAAHIVADGFMFGKLPPCPICGNSALVQYGGEVRCKGYISATTKCVFSFVLSDLLRPDETPDNSSTGVAVADLERKELLVLPDEAKRIPVFKQWKRPEGVEGCMQLSNPLSEEMSRRSCLPHFR
ncbi:hypothetical protein ACSSS7_006361 [Eimeria intestinalis]